METIIINSAEELKRYDEKGRVYIDGNLRICCDLICKCSIFASGDIIAGRALTADGSVTVGGHIEASGSIISDGYINAGWYINAGGSIKVCGDIKAQYIFSFNFDITAKSIQTTGVPFGRKYWSDKKPLKPWREAILNHHNCYDDLRAIMKSDAEKICAWKHWHWIEKAHLLMFFGLIDKYEIK
jgi:hypothetical protein